LSQHDISRDIAKETVMPSFDLPLPPQAYPAWRAARPQPRTRDPVSAAWGIVSLWIERVSQRDALAGLDDRQLRDIGVTRAEAARECEKPFWR
jgi:uncharacterized protein YjiS (DUF1127 family)